MSKKLLSGPYLVWMVGFTVIPLLLIVYYGLTDRTGAFTLANIISITTAEHAKALWLSLGLSFINNTGLLAESTRQKVLKIIKLSKVFRKFVSILGNIFCKCKN